MCASHRGTQKVLCNGAWEDLPGRSLLQLPEALADKSNRLPTKSCAYFSVWFCLPGCSQEQGSRHERKVRLSDGSDRKPMAPNPEAMHRVAIALHRGHCMPSMRFPGEHQST